MASASGLVFHTPKKTACEYEMHWNWQINSKKELVQKTLSHIYFAITAGENLVMLPQFNFCDKCDLAI